MELAKVELVSPDTIQRQVNNYASQAGLAEIDFGKQLYAWITNFNKGYKNLTEALLGDPSTLSTRDYIRKTEEVFETPFFDLLRQYLKQYKKGPGIVQTVMDISLLDARSIHTELT